MSGCVTLRVFFGSGRVREFPIHQGGDWRYTESDEGPARIIIRPYGGARQNDGQVQCRHEIPLSNVDSVMVVPAAALGGGS